MECSFFRSFFYIVHQNPNKTTGTFDMKTTGRHDTRRTPMSNRGNLHNFH